MTILGADSIPVPPSEIVARLQRIDPDLGLRWMPCGPGHSYWALSYKWQPNDPRWARVQNGALAEERAWDMICQVPIDCAVDEVYGWFVNNLRAATDDNIKNLLNRADQYNAKVEDEQWKEVEEAGMEYFTDRLNTNMSKSGARPQSYGGLESSSDAPAGPAVPPDMATASTPVPPKRAAKKGRKK